jgi:hypothetical protein
MKRVLLWTVYVLLVGTICLFLDRIWNPWHWGVSAKSQPYTVEISDQETRIPTGEVKESRHIIAVRGDGSRVDVNLLRSREDPTKWVPSVRRIDLLPEQKTVLISDAIESVSTEVHSQDATRNARRSPVDPNCRSHDALGAGKSRLIGEGEVLGFQVVKHLEEDSQSKYEVWEAPDLGCFPLRTVFEWKKENGQLESRTITAALSVVRGEPSPDLFQVSPHYAEKPLAVFNGDLRKKFNLPDEPTGYPTQLKRPDEFHDRSWQPLRTQESK